MRIILAGGGTGGHIFPGIALIEEFKRIDRVEFLFIGSNRGMGTKILERLAIPCRTLDIEGFKGRGPIKKIVSILKLMRSFPTSFSIIKEFNPDCVIGLGSYTAFPIVVAATVMGKKTVLLEQNLLPGLTNRLLAPFANHIFVSFKDTLNYFPEGKTTFVGNPVRRGIVSSKGRKRERFTILIFGGSQGARGINSLMIEALEFLDDLKAGIDIIHQASKEDMRRLKEAYRDKGFKADVINFIDDMGMAYIQSHLVICRGGATTIAELTVKGKASIIIPFPHAADNHQYINASFLKKHGAALVVKEKEANGEKLAMIIRDLYRSPSSLKRMEEMARDLGQPEAASNIVDMCSSFTRDRVSEYVSQ